MLRYDLKNLPPKFKSQIQSKLSEWKKETATVDITEEIKDAPVVRKTSPIQAKLWQAVCHMDGIVAEFKGAVPNRRFSLDIAFPNLKIAIEADGWQYHGKYLSAHRKDRERQNLLVLEGWSILRYTAAQINNDLDTCINEIESLIRLVEKEQK